MLSGVMGRNGLNYFRSSSVSEVSGSEGIITSNDIVLIKMNGEWLCRGGANSDVVKGLVNAIARRPDRSFGEFAIVEDGQWDSCTKTGTTTAIPTPATPMTVANPSTT